MRLSRVNIFREKNTNVTGQVEGNTTSFVVLIHSVIRYYYYYFNEKH